VSETYYGGALSLDTLQLPLGLYLLTEETRELLFFSISDSLCGDARASRVS